MATEHDAGGDPRPAWARRMRAERHARGWSQADAVQALEAHAKGGVPGTASLLRNWKRWEAGDSEPDDFYKPLIARTFGTVCGAFFPPPGNRVDDALRAGSGMDTLELVSRIRASDASQATLDALRITADRLCAQYPYAAAEQLSVEGREWLRRICSLLDRRLTLAQHREVLSLAGMVSLLIGCVEHDLGLANEARATRRAALSLGEECGDADVIGWAHELAAWFSLTRSDYRGAVHAADAGRRVAPERGVAVQLTAQEAKAWARIGDRCEMERALAEGRALLERLPYPDDVDHHFVVDPAKFDFYAMDCYRIIGDHERATICAHEVVRSSTDADGTQRKPMRVAEANLTLAVVAAQAGDLDQALELGRTAVTIERRSLPSLLLATRELRHVLTDRYAADDQVDAFLDQLRVLSAAA
jgi:hypothetical protein